VTPGGMITGQLKPPLYFLKDKHVHTANGELVEDQDPSNMRIKNMTITDPSSYYKEALKRKGHYGETDIEYQPTIK
jgi:hypothetical protein